MYDLIKKLPNELCNEVKLFYYGKCNKCNKNIEFFKLKKDIKTKKYFSVFDKNYMLDERDWTFYKYICLNCIHENNHFIINEKKIYYF